MGDICAVVIVFGLLNHLSNAQRAPLNSRPMVVPRAAAAVSSLTLVSHHHRSVEDYFYLYCYRARFTAHFASSDTILKILVIQFEVNVGTDERFITHE